MAYQFAFLGSAMNPANYLMNLALANQFQGQSSSAVPYGTNQNMNTLSQASFNARTPLENALASQRDALLSLMHGMGGNQVSNEDRGNNSGFMADTDYRNTFRNSSQNNQVETMLNIHSQGMNFPPETGGSWIRGEIPSGMTSTGTVFPSARDRMLDYPAERDIFDYSLRNDSNLPTSRSIGNPDFQSVRDHREQNFLPRRVLQDPDIPLVRDYKAQDFSPRRGFEELIEPYNRASMEPGFSTRRSMLESGLSRERDSPRWGSPDAGFRDKSNSFRKDYPDDPFASRSNRYGIDRRLSPDRIGLERYSRSETERPRDSKRFTASRSQERLQPDAERTKFSVETRKREFSDESEWPGKRGRFDFDVKQRDSSPHRNYIDYGKYSRRDNSPGRMEPPYGTVKHDDPLYGRGRFDSYPVERERREHSPYTQPDYRGHTSNMERHSTYHDEGEPFYREHESYSYTRSGDDTRFNPGHNLHYSSNQPNSDRTYHANISVNSGYMSDDVSVRETYYGGEMTKQGNNLIPNYKNTLGKNGEENDLSKKPISVAVVPQGYPEKGGLTREEVEEFKKILIDQIYQLDPNGAISPRFCACIYSGGAIILKVLDIYTKNWLSALLDSHSANIRLSNGKKLLFRSAKITRSGEMFIGLFPKYNSKLWFIKTLVKSNPGINTSTWNILDATISQLGCTVGIRIPKASIAELEKNNYMVSFLQQKIKLSPAKKKNSVSRPRK